MNPVIIHADGTDCHHIGDAQATVYDPDGPRCPAGERVTHVRFNGKTITIEQATQALIGIGETMSKFISGLGGMFSNIGAALAPVLRSLEPPDSDRPTR
jgi:hypothetical protein